MKKLKNLMVSIPVLYPRSVIATFICITILFSIFLPSLKINTSLRSLIEQKGEDREYCEKVKKIFGNEEMIVITFSGKDLFTYKKLNQLQTLTESFFEYEYIEDVKSIFTSRNISDSEDGITVNPVFDEIPQNAAQIEQKVRTVLDNPLFVGNIISRDGKHLSFILHLVAMEEEEYTNLNVMEKTISYVKNEINKSDIGLEVHYGGFPEMRVYSSRLTQRDFLVMAPIIFFLICLIIYLHFRSFKILFLAIGALCLNLTWAVSLMAALNVPITVATSMIPTLLLIVSSSYIIHMISIYYFNLNRNEKKIPVKEIIKKSTGYMIIPLLFIAMTTMVGFSSLSVSPLITIKQLGLFLAAGIFFIFIITVMLIPACLTLIKLDHEKILKREKYKLVDSVMLWLNRLVARRPGYIVLIFCIVVVITLYKIPQIEMKQDNLELFKKNSALRQDAYFINEHFDGANNLLLIIEANKPEAFKNPALLHKVEDIQEYMHKKKVIDNTQSIVDVVKLLNKSLNDHNENFYVIPESKDAVAQYLLINSNATSRKDTSRLVSYDYDKIAVSFRLNNYDTKQWLQAQREIEKYAKNILPEGYTVRVSGSLFLLARGFATITQSMMSSIILATTILTILMCLLFRSVIVGILTIIPNLMPILITLGVLSWLNIQLDMITSTFGCIALGIAVDDTIHFTKSFFLELEESNDVDNAVKYGLLKAGAPMTITTLAISIGFSIFAFSEFQLLKIFGLLCAFVMALCLVVDLTLLPVVLKKYVMVMKSKKMVPATDVNKWSFKKNYN